MAQWGVRGAVAFVSQQEDSKPLLLSSTGDEEKVTVKTEPLLLPEITKRKRLSRNQLKEVKASLNAKEMQNSSMHRTKKHDCNVQRWSTERYKLAEENMLEILKAEGATFENPISRPALRTAARKRIGDTGLLDHLLKHIDGKVAPGGTERFRRWFNINGIMEYWLEDADLVNVRKQAGVQDPYWVPPSGLRGRGSGPFEEHVSAEELKELKAELNKMKSDMQELVSKKQDQHVGNQVEEMLKEMMKWKAETENSLKAILSSWKGMQDMYGELVTLKAKLEQQLVEIKTLLSSSTQEVKQHPASSPQPQPSERWEDWLEITKLDDVQGNEFMPWFDGTNLVNAEQEVVMDDICSLFPLQSKPGDSQSWSSACARELEQLKEEMTNKNKDIQECVPKNQKEDQINVTPDSSTTVNSVSELHNSSFLCQEMFVELFNWKAKMEQKLIEITNSITIIRQATGV
ncbi:hypothetical protein UlMin_030595 [Ulmus minor]